MEGPYLIAPHDAYWSATPKVAFVGQETNGWASEHEIIKQMEAYTLFHLGERWPGPFWNVIRKFEETLTGAKYSSVALNLNRYDQAGKPPSGSGRKLKCEEKSRWLQSGTYMLISLPKSGCTAVRSLPR